MDESTAPDPALVERVARRLGRSPAAWAPVSGGGHSAATCWIVTCADGSSAFVKAAIDVATAAWLRLEHHVYAYVQAGTSRVTPVVRRRPPRTHESTPCSARNWARRYRVR